MTIEFQLSTGDAGSLIYREYRPAKLTLVVDSVEMFMGWMKAMTGEEPDLRSRKRQVLG